MRLRFHPRKPEMANNAFLPFHYFIFLPLRPLIPKSATFTIKLGRNQRNDLHPAATAVWAFLRSFRTGAPQFQHIYEKLCAPKSVFSLGPQWGRFYGPSERAHRSPSTTLGAHDFIGAHPQWPCCEALVLSLQD